MVAPVLALVLVLVLVLVVVVGGRDQGEEVEGGGDAEDVVEGVCDAQGRSGGRFGPMPVLADSVGEGERPQGIRTHPLLAVLPAHPQGVPADGDRPVHLPQRG